MTEQLVPEDVPAALCGGAVLSAGGTGRERLEKDRGFAARAFEQRAPRLISLADLADNANVMIATAVGAPGGGKRHANPDYSIAAARRLMEVSSQSFAAVMPGHVPGLYAWLLAAAMDVPLLDAACNGRGYPTVAIGSLGLSARSDYRLFQSGVGEQVEICVKGNMVVTSALMRAAAVQNGGLVMAARGPIGADVVKSAGAPGTISYQLGLGRAMLAAASPEACIEAAFGFTRGRALARGTVMANSVQYVDGFDVGSIEVRDDSTGERVCLGVCNEFMTASRGGRRVATFPDLIAALDRASGQALAIDELKEGTELVVLATDRNRLPTGSGVLDATQYVDIERAMGAPLSPQDSSRSG
jgi:hypothetical protein